MALREGGKILTTMTGYLHASSRVLVTKHDHDTAEAVFLPGTVSFMPARAHQAPPLGRLPSQAEGINKAADPETAAFLTDWTMRWIAQLAAPQAVNVGLGMQDGTTMQVLNDPRTGATVWLHEGYVTEHEPHGMWRRITAALEDWRAAWSPPQAPSSASRSRADGKSSRIPAWPRHSTCRSNRRPRQGASPPALAGFLRKPGRPVSVSDLARSPPKRTASDAGS